MSLFQFAAQYAPWIYAACGLAALYNVYRIWLIRAERRQAVFALERDKAKRDLYSVFFAVLMLVAAMGSTYFVSNVLPEAFDVAAVQSTPTSIAQPQSRTGLAPDANGLLPTPTFTPEPPTVTPPPAPALSTVPPPTPTPLPAVIELATPTSPPPAGPAPVVQAPVCPAPQASIVQPGNGQVVKGLVSVIGTAVHEQFHYYKLEYAPGAAAEGGYAFLSRFENQVNNGLLATVNSADLPNGTWTLQLTVVDLTGNFPAPCRVTITTQN